MLDMLTESFRRKAANVAILSLGGCLVAGLWSSATLASQARDAVAAERASYTSPISYTSPPSPTSVAFVGDSFTVGTGAAHRSNRWTTLVAHDENWLELNYGVGGTNYATTGKLAKGRSYQEHLTDLIISEPDVVFVSSAGNNLEEDQSGGIRSTFRTLREALPNAKIYATSPYPVAYREVHEDFGKQIKDEVEAVGGEYIELEDPLEEDPALTAEDGFHPNDMGHQLIADAVLGALPK